MEFSISFDNSTRVFHPGAVITGTVTLKLREPCSARYVLISVEGSAHTWWTVSKTRTVMVNGKSTTETYQVTHSAKVSYAQGENVAWGNGNKEKMPVGEHKFPFSFQIPLVCAPSFEGNYGHIRYHCKAVVDRPWKFDHIVKQPFTVIPSFNLNTIPSLFHPVTSAICENTGVVLFRKGKVEMTISTPKGGFVPGEMIPVQVNVMNMSKKCIKKVEVKLIEHSQYVAPSGCTHYSVNTCFVKDTWLDNNRHEKRNAAVVTMPWSVPRDSKASQIIQLRIPPCVSTFNICPIIQVYYKLKVKVLTESTFNNCISTDAPVVIGTVPLCPSGQFNAGIPPTIDRNACNGPPYPHGPNSTFPSPPLYPPTVVPARKTASDSTVPSAPPLIPSSGIGPAAAYDELAGPPPSYEESVFGASRGVGEQSEKNPAFAPRYVYYNLHGQPQPHPPSDPQQSPAVNSIEKM